MAEPHAEVRRALRSAVKLGRLPQALLLTGEEGIGKLALAEWLVQLRWCEGADAPCGNCPSCRKVSSGNHPDHLVLSRARDAAGATGPGATGSRQEITVDQVRQEILPLLSVRASGGRGRAVVLAGADDLNVEAQNALLKVLEEPPPECLLVLVTSREEALLDTIRSRCHELRLFAPLAAQVAAAGGREASAEASPGPPAGLDPTPVVAALDLLLQGRTTASQFAQDVGQAVGGDEGADAEAAARVLAVLQRRARELALRACSDNGSGPNLGTAHPGQPAHGPSPQALLQVLALLLEAAQDLQRHMPGHVVWLALGRGIRSAAVGGRGAADR